MTNHDHLGIRHMDQALRTERRLNERPSPEAMSRDGRVSDELTKILAQVRAPDEERGMNQPRSGPNPDKPDWSASLDMIRHTAEAMRTSADRAQKMEARTQALLQRAAKELENAHERIETLEARLRACEAREKQAEARAKDAEEWLRRIHNAIAEELPSSVSLLQNSPGAASDDNGR